MILNHEEKLRKMIHKYTRYNQDSDEVDEMIHEFNLVWAEAYKMGVMDERSEKEQD